MSETDLHILQVLDNYFPIVDGPVYLISNYARCFNKKDGVRCEVLVPYYPKYTDNQPFKVNRIFSIFIKKSLPRLPLPFFDPNTKRILKNGNFDIIHAHSPVTLGRYVAKFARKNNIPIVFTMHTKFHEEINRKNRFKIIQKMSLHFLISTINKMDYVLAVSEGAADCLRNYGFKGKIDICRNGTDLVYPTIDMAPTIQKITDQYKLNDAENIFLFVGRIVVVKKIQSILRVLAILKQRGLSFKMIIVGDGDYLDEIKRQTHSLNLDDVIVFTGKVMDRDTLSAYYLRSDLFLFPSTFDTASLVPLEAAALKLPSLLVKGCSSAEIITDGVNGYLAEESDIAWANKIEEIIQNKEKLKAVKEACYNEVFKTWESVTDEILEKYAEYIADYKQNRAKK